LSLFGGKKEVMEHVSPVGDAQHSGTYNANLIEILAGNAFMDYVVQKDVYSRLLSKCDRLYKETNAMMRRLDFPGRLNGLGARFSLVFGEIHDRPVEKYSDLIDNDWGLLNRFFRACLNNGLFLHTMQHHGISMSHSDADIDRILEGFEKSLKTLLKEGVRTEKTSAAFF
jgi:glutamate-1-semialdehyde 2,1-aminomutase